MSSLDMDEVLRNFDIRAYDVTREWSVCEWEFALARRRHFIRNPDLYRQLYDIDETVQRLLDTALLTAHPGDHVFDPTVTDLMNFAAWGFRDIIKSQPDVATACVEESSGPPPFESDLDEGSEEWYQKLLESVQDEEPNPLASGSFNKLLAAKYESDTAYVEVQLSAPDEIIISDFRKWLASVRQDSAFDHSPVRRFTEKELRRWSSNQVLPFLDLRISAWAAGVEIPYHALGEILFPQRDVDVAEKVRKGTLPLAEELMTLEQGEALQAAANAFRRAGRNL